MIHPAINKTLMEIFRISSNIGQGASCSLNLRIDAHSNEKVIKLEINYQDLPYAGLPGNP